MPEGYWGNGKRRCAVRHLWGRVYVAVQRLVDREGRAKQVFCDKRLDHSGWTPKALACLNDLATRVPLEEGAHIARSFGLKISSSELDRLQRPYAEACRTEVALKLLSCPEPEPTSRPRRRVMVLQIDGVYVLGRPEQGVCPGLELKTAVLYPQAAPSERWMLAERCCAEDFLALVAGLLKQAEVTSADTLVGLGDGAAWITNTFGYLDAVRITDVYHAAQYLDTVMQAMNCDEDVKTQHRREWVCAQVNARDWLERHLPHPDIWLAWSEAAQTALNYLETRLDSMDYAHFKAQGYPIGSGQVEGMNKAVIGHRMKRSGMHWSKQGAAGMASLRAQTCAKHSLVSFQHLRHLAYPAPA